MIAIGRWRFGYDPLFEIEREWPATSIRFWVGMLWRLRRDRWEAYRAWTTRWYVGPFWVQRFDQ